MVAARPGISRTLIGILILMISSAASAAETGDLWEVTAKMSMEGMPMEMPAQTSKVCSAKEWTKPPAPADDRQKCQYSDFMVVGAKATWKVTCVNPGMTGEGEITRDGAAAFTGMMKMSGEHGVMKMKLDGKRIGECDPAKQ